MLKKNRDGSYNSLDAALEAYDKKIEAQQNESEQVETTVTIDATQWEEEIDDSIQMIQIMGVPGADSDDFGLTWYMEIADGARL